MSDDGFVAVEGFERASRICVFAEKGDGSPALDGGVLDLRTKTHRQGTSNDRRRHAISSATSCDNAYIYATTNFWEGTSFKEATSWTIQSGDLYPVSATILNGKATLFWLDGSHPRNAYKWSRGRGGPGAEDSCTPFLQHHGVEFSALTVSNQVGWLGLRVQERVWQVDLITETVLAVFQSPSKSYVTYARPDGGLWAVSDDAKDVRVEVWKPVLEPRAHKPIMMRRIVPTTTQN
ncbi:hypothetical protein FOZ60_015575 [Perkinsus olseni]|uniref:Uncharacterized protein n=1 Tax=Perkinsus olseni TaxID=32597 RepID=A0A7J6N6I2_PEROL|nr:hypothetical protein FOZ60_015575 [Perkinsus olseni]